MATPRTSEVFTKSPKLEDIIFGDGDGRYSALKPIGVGSFGIIYLGIDHQTNEEVAIKVEKRSSNHPQLLQEYEAYKAIRYSRFMPQIRWFGCIGREYILMVMDLLGFSLDRLFRLYSHQFSLKTTLMLADQMILRVWYMHARHFIHRDIKPDNFCVGIGENSNQIYLIDLGLCKQYRDPRSLQHMSQLENKKFCGSLRYASINAHLGLEQSRRDDLESLGYIFIYFLKGKLPWQNQRAYRVNYDKNYKRIKELKINTSLADLCEGCPQEFGLYLEYCRSLSFDEKPDYLFLRQLFRKLLSRLEFRFDFMFDWDIETKTAETEDEFPKWKE